MKKPLLLIIFSFFFFYSFSQNSEILKKLFNAESQYVKNEIPDTFQFFYKSFLIDYKIIIDSLTNRSNYVNLQEADTVYYLHAIDDAYLDENWGMIWAKNFMISYYYNNYSKEFESENKEHGTFQPFIRDVERWNENVCDRSYRWSSIAGASFIVCTKIITHNFTSQSCAFKEYSKCNSPWIYLKEKKEDGYEQNRIINWCF